MTIIVDINQSAPSIIGCERKYNSVVVDGLEIPRMGCIERGEFIEIILDNRWSFTFPKNIAYLAACFAAHAMAIGEGYSHPGAEKKGYPFAPKVFMIEEGKDGNITN